MAVTIYNMLNFSDSIIESLEVGNLLPGLDHFLSLNLYAKQFVISSISSNDPLSLYYDINNKLNLRLK